MIRHLILRSMFLICAFILVKQTANGTEDLHLVLNRMQETHHRISRMSSVNTYVTTYKDGENGMKKVTATQTLLQYHDNFLLQKEVLDSGLVSRHSVHSFNGKMQKNWNTINNDRFPNGAGSFILLSQVNLKNKSLSENFWMQIMSDISSGNWLRYVIVDDALPIYQVFMDNFKKASLTIRNIEKNTIYVLHVNAEQGDYYIEVDPQKSYNIQSAKILRKRELGHFVGDKIYWEGIQEREFSFFDVKYEFVDSTWIAISAKAKLRTITADEEYNQDILMAVNNICMLESEPDINQFDFVWPEGAFVKDRNKDISFRAGVNNVLLQDDIDAFEGELKRNIRDSEMEKVKETDGLYTQEGNVQSSNRVNSNFPGADSSGSRGSAQIELIAYFALVVSFVILCILAYLHFRRKLQIR